MSATRTQVYLSKEQRQLVDEAAVTDGVTMAEIVRRAVDAYLAERVPDAAAALAATFATTPDADVPSRDEWDRG